MKTGHFKFDHYAIGFACLFIVGILPIISPIIYFVNNKSGLLPYILIMVGIFGVLYEFSFPKQGLAGRTIKIENFIITIYSLIFLIYDIALLIVRAEKTSYEYGWFDYSAVCYCIVPIVITIFETIRTIKEHFKEYINKDNNKIATGNATNV